MPTQPLLLEMMFLVIVGEALETKMPPPEVPQLAAVRPFRMVSSVRSEAEVSPVTNFTTQLVLPPSMMVVEGPLALLTVMALPLKSMFSV
jgi:hypothetical protein